MQQTIPKVNNEECTLTVQTQIYLSGKICYMFRLHIAIVMLNTEPEVGKNKNKTMQLKYYGRDLVLQYSSYGESYNKWKKNKGYRIL
jgi:hypothetical protein